MAFLPLRFLPSVIHLPALFSAYFQMAVMISSGFIVAWTPYVVVSFWSIFASEEQGPLTPLVTLLPCLFAKSSTVYNPIIYFIFRRTSQNKFPCLQRLACCSRRAKPPAEEVKKEGETVKGSDCEALRDGSDGTYMGLVGAVALGGKSGNEMISLG